MRKYISIFFVTLIMSTTCFADMYVLLCADTPKDIGFATKMANRDMEKFVKAVAGTLKQPLHLTKLVGNDLSGKAILHWLHTTQTTKNDIVLVHYAGHGMREKTNYTPWPYLQLLSSKEIFPTATIVEHLSTKQHQLMLCVFDCCNSYISNFPYEKEKKLSLVSLDAPEAPVQQKSSDNNKSASNIACELFKKKGSIIITGAQPGKPGFASLFFGMHFSSSFFKVLNARSELSDWNMALKLVSKDCDKTAHYFLDTQQPFYFVSEE